MKTEVTSPCRCKEAYDI